MYESRISRLRKQRNKVKKRVALRTVICLCAVIVCVGFAGLLAAERYAEILLPPKAGNGDPAEPSSMTSQEAEEAGFYWGHSYDNTINIEWYSGGGGDVVIPSEIDGISVTGIGDYAFDGCDSLTSVDIPDSVTFIGSGAFMYCSSLEGVKIPNSLTGIGSDTF
jgi:hypothetical protein